MLSGYSFRPRGWAALLAAFACASGIALGNWQAGRAHEKRALGEERAQAMREPPIEISKDIVDPHTIVQKRVAVTGRFLPQHTVFLMNRLRDGRSGYEVVTPLQTNGMHVLVNRGWVAAQRPGGPPPEVPTPSGEIRVEGIALARLPHALELGNVPAGKVRQNLELEPYGRETGLRLQPIFIEQRSPAPDGLQRTWPRPDAGVEKHESYALQWYSLAGLAVVLFVVLSFKRVGTP